MRITLFIAISLLAIGLSIPVSAQDIAVEKTESGVVVKVGDQPFTTYVFQSKVKPILWPILGRPARK
jgi:hypothetical protein